MTPFELQLRRDLSLGGAGRGAGAPAGGFWARAPRFIPRAPRAPGGAKEGDVGGRAVALGTGVGAAVGVRELAVAVEPTAHQPARATHGGGERAAEEHLRRVQMVKD